MIPYERIVQWAAGPIAILAGWGATQLVQHIHLFGTLGVGKDQVAHAIVVAVTFVVGAGTTYAAHHKWLSNVPLWWAYQLTDGQSAQAEVPVSPMNVAPIPNWVGDSPTPEQIQTELGVTS